MKVIFLDIDGVLNNVRTANNPRDSFGVDRLDKDCIRRLNKITDTTGAVIVISSTWRKMYLWSFTQGILFNKLREEGVTGAIIGITPDDRECGYINEEYPDGSRGIRGYEIKHWLNKSRQDVEAFVILDDDSDMVDLFDHFVHIKDGWKTGILDEHVEKAIEILNGPVAKSV